MSKKTLLFGLLAFLILSVAVSLICGLSWGDKTSAGVGTLPVRDNSPEKGKTTPAALNAKAHALISDVGRVPAYFVPNRGQTDDRVSFYVHGNDKTVYFAPDGLTLALSCRTKSGSSNEPKRWVVKLDFLGAREDVKPEGVEETGAAISYFRGKPEEWKTGLPAYSRIIYRDLWPGIDLVYKGEMNKLKYEFVVHPGADPSKIKLAYRGVERVALTGQGRLEVKTPAGAFEDDAPVAYQEVNGERTAVRVAYALPGVIENQISGSVSGLENRPAMRPEGTACVYGFEMGEYDRNRILILDPAVLVYCGYIGGANGDECSAIAVDGSGCVYLAGPTTSDETSFPVAAGPDLTYNGERSSFVAKVNASGTGLVYCGYIGSAGEGLSFIAVDSAGNAYIAASTYATETTFPVTVGPDLTHNGGSDAFVAKVNPSGTGLVYCGYIGGAGTDVAMAIAVDDVGNAYVAGHTRSTETTFPVRVGPDLTANGLTDCFVSKVNSSGSGLDYCGFIGGSADDAAVDLAVDGSGNAYVTGMPGSTEATFPVKAGPDLTYNGGGDVFVAKVKADGTGLEYCGYIGGTGDDSWSTIAVDGSGNAYVVGATRSTQSTFPVKVGPDLTHNGFQDAFIAKINPSGTDFIYCGYVGGSSTDYACRIAVDGSGNAYIVGLTNSNESSFSVVDGPDLTYNGNLDAFIAKVNSSGTALVYCGYIGGTADDEGIGIAVDGSGNAYLCGHTLSDQSTFPVVEGPDLTYNGGGDGFVAKVSDIPGPPVTSLVPDSADAGDPGFLLSVIGSDFVDGAVVRWDGSARTTTFISSSELQATIDASDLVAGKTVYVTVRNPNGGISIGLPFAIHNPVPSLGSISPTHVTGGGAAFTLTIQGTNFVPNSVVRWNGNNRTTTYVSGTELQAAITTTDLATGGNAQVTIFNPAPAGGTSGALAVEVSSFTLSSSPASVTVTAGQSAIYTVTLTPQYGSFDSAVTFACAGLPSKCTAVFSPPSATPGAAAVTTTLTLTTAAAASTGVSAVSLTGLFRFGLPFAGLFPLAALMLLKSAVSGPMTRRLARPRLAACALLVLAVIIIGSCSSGGDGNNPPPYTGTPKGTHTISVQATSGNMTVPTSITLAVK